MAGTQHLKRIPLIKFPQRHPKASAASTSSGSGSQPQMASASGKAQESYSLRSEVPAPPSNTALGGKASLQPKRTPVSDKEIEAVLVMYARRVPSLHIDTRSNPFVRVAECRCSHPRIRPDLLLSKNIYKGQTYLMDGLDIAHVGHTGTCDGVYMNCLVDVYGLSKAQFAQPQPLFFIVGSAMKFISLHRRIVLGGCF